MTSRADPPPAEQCDRCGRALIPIAYGYPSIEMLDAAERGGEILLGGCIVDDGQPTSRCPACGPADQRRTRG